MYMHDEGSPLPALNSEQLLTNRYRLRQPLGKGTFGQVFLAEDIKFQPPKIVALKVLHPQFINDAQVRADIGREASTLARFNHPNILRVIDFEVSENLAYIVTDLAEGGSLANKIRPDPTRPPVRMPLAEVGRYLEQIADALDEAHLQGLIHRDIKPLNILLDKRSHPLLADFGLAAALSGSQSSVLVDTSSSGTPLYMAPEQWNGQAGKASDIYALGVVVYQLITGQPPYTGNQAALWAQHMNAPVPRLSDRAPDLRYPLALDEVLAAAMAKDPHQRTRSAGEFARRFQAVLGEATSPASERTVAVPLPPPPGQQVSYQPVQMSLDERTASLGPVPGNRTQYQAHPSTLLHGAAPVHHTDRLPIVAPPAATLPPEKKQPRFTFTITCGVVASLAVLLVAAALVLLNFSGPSGVTNPNVAGGTVATPTVSTNTTTIASATTASSTTIASSGSAGTTAAVAVLPTTAAATSQPQTTVAVVQPAATSAATTSSATTAVAATPAATIPAATTPVVTTTAPLTARQQLLQSNGLVIFTLFRNNENSLWTASLSSGTFGPPRQVVPNSAGDAAISPDGRFVAFHTNAYSPKDAGGKPTTTEVYVAPVDNFEARVRIERGVSPSWSPDGRSLLWVSTELGCDGDDIVRVQLDRTQPNRVTPTGPITQVTCDGLRKRSPRLGVNNEIVFSLSSEKLDQRNMRIMKVAGNSVKATRYTELAPGLFPMWSPDGSKIVWATGDNEGRNAQVWTMNANGSNRVQLTSAGWNYRPQWLPNGLILFSSNRERASQTSTSLWVMNPNGSQQERLPIQGEEDIFSVWGWFDR